MPERIHVDLILDSGVGAGNSFIVLTSTPYILNYKPFWYIHRFRYILNYALCLNI